VTKAGIVGVTFHDLRGTAVTRLAIVGCTAPEIASLTGHSLRDVNAILDAHYLHRDPALAESAIRKLERGTNRVANLPTVSRLDQNNPRKSPRNQIANDSARALTAGA
jgi:hypothetical protein